MRAALRREFPTLLMVAAPLALAQLAQNGMSFVDTLMAGRLGPEALAGIAVGSISFFFVVIVLSSLLFAMGPMVAQATGANEPEDAVHTLRQGVLVALLLTPLGVSLLWLMPSFLAAIGQEQAVVALARGYLWAISGSVLPFMLFTALRAYLEGQGRTRPLMVVSLLAVGLNVLANQAFMFGRWGFPALGLTGTGVATTLVYSVAAAVAVAYVASVDRARQPWVLPWRMDFARMREIVRLGWPISMTVAFETGLFTISALLMGRFGADALAGHQVAIQTASFTFMIPLAVGVATTARVGHAVGRGDPAGARAAGVAGIITALFVMTLTATLFLTAPQWVVSLYLDPALPANAAVVALAVRFLAIAAVFQVFDGLQVSALGALRGLKDTRAPMLITLFAYWVVGLGSGLVLAFGFGWRGEGLWWGLVVGLMFAGVLLAWRFTVLLRRLRPKRVPAVDLSA